jgi:TonB-dependent SusC/RagA subfamily outer membrane receptor
MKVFLILVFLLTIVRVSFSQEPAPKDTLVGLIVNKSGKAIKNVPVSVAGHKDMTYSNRKGIFMVVGEHLPDSVTIMLPSKKLYQIPVGGMKFLKISTNETAFSVSQAKDEIVNIGYGSILKSHSTSGNYTITGDELRQTGERDIIMAIAGKVPGLNLVYNNNGTATLRLRGGASLDGNDDPLYIVDGSIVDDLLHLNMNDVAKVDVLKDGSIYGARGANGAIVVTTKN